MPLAQAEAGTQTWFAWRIGTSTFGVFDTFEDEDGRQEHVSGEIAKVLMANADELPSQPPDISPIDLLAEKLPRQPAGATRDWMGVGPTGDPTPIQSCGSADPS